TFHKSHACNSDAQIERHDDGGNSRRVEKKEGRPGFSRGSARRDRDRQSNDGMGVAGGRNAYRDLRPGRRQGKCWGPHCFHRRGRGRTTPRRGKGKRERATGGRTGEEANSQRRRKEGRQAEGAAAARRKKTEAGTEGTKGGSATEARKEA